MGEEDKKYLEEKIQDIEEEFACFYNMLMSNLGKIKERIDDD